MLETRVRSSPLDSMRVARFMERRNILAFTLVELLVVVVITALLVAMFVTTLARAKEKSRTTQCISNLRQWGVAFWLYTDENEDRLPRRGQGVQVLFQIDRPDDWFNALPPFLGLASFQQLVATVNRPVAKARSVFICPTAHDPGGRYFLSYAMNMNLCPRNLPTATRVSEVVRPRAVVALADSPGPYSATFPSARPYSPVPRHGGRVNLLFLDGQVQGFAGNFVGCGVGDPRREDVRWLTGTPSDTQASAY